MSQIQRVEQYSKKLREYCEDPIQSEEVLQTVKDIGSELILNISEGNIDNICSILLNSDGPVQFFFTKCRGATSGDLATAISEMLKILCTFLKKRRRHSELQKYAKDLLNQCHATAVKKGHATTRATAVEIITIMFDVNNKYDTADFDTEGIYKSFCDQFTQQRTPMGVKAKIVQLLGVIARYYPSVVDEAQLKKIKRWCMDNITAQVNGSVKLEANAISGYMDCMNSILYRSETIIKAQSDDSDKILSSIHKILVIYQGQGRYAAPISALMLFKEHSELFSNLLILNYQKIYDVLFYWASHHNSNAYKYGLGAYEEFIKRISITLYDDMESETRNKVADNAILAFFMRKFITTLEDVDNLDNIYHISVAIRSVGYFSKIVAKKYTPDKVEELRNSLVRISEWFYSETNENQSEYIRHLPAFIKSYTSFAEVFDIIPIELMETLHKMCDIFVMSFPQMSGYHRRNGSFYIQQLLNMLYAKGESVFKGFVNTFFERTLICTCTNIQSPDKEDRPAYTELLYFWKVILNISFLERPDVKQESDSQQKDEEDIEAEDLYNLYTDMPSIASLDLPDALYDSFISSFKNLISTFNLKLKQINEYSQEDKDESTQNFNVVSKSLQPVNRKDFILFQNLVDFWSVVLKELDNSRLHQWVYILSSMMIDYSVINPLVSGFYRIMAEVLSICEKSKFFEGCNRYITRTKNRANKKDQSMPSEFATYLLIREFLKEVWHRLQQFTDELLASCLKLILAYPTEFFDTLELVTPLEKALRLGITYHPLATIAMDSLDKILDPNLNYEIDSQFLSKILPCINEYLLVGVVSFQEGGNDRKKKAYKAPTASQRKYESVHIKMTSDQLGVVKRNYAGLPELQKRIMQFLGRLGGKNKQLILQGDEAINNSGILAWDSEKRLKIRVPFMNVKVNIYLDEFLPRICELAESSSERQVKVAACELLHSIITLVVAERDTLSKSEEEIFNNFFTKIFPVMLKLATDPDQIARDMFQLLLTQIIHYFTSANYANSSDPIILSKALLKAAYDTDAGLRDYGADCLHEFVKWSIKHSPRSTDAIHNIKSLLRRLYNLMDSPSSSKRFGAALVFNRIYRIFREEPSLVNTYTFEILGHLFYSLQVAEADHASIGTRDQIVEAISHIKRIIREKSSIFLDDNGRNPFTVENHVSNLKELVTWTFIESGRLQRTYAKVCINFFAEFVTLLPKFKTGKDWLSEQLRSDSSFLTSVFEPNQLVTPSVMDDEAHVISSYLNWIKQFNSTVDGYIWIIEREVIDADQLLMMPSSVFLNSILFFIDNTPSDFLEEKLDQNVTEKHKITSIYTHIAIRLVYFFDLAFRSEKGAKCFSYVKRCFSTTLYKPGFTDIIANALILPKTTSEIIQLYQGNAVTQSGIKRMIEISINFITIMQQNSDEGFLNALAESICRILQNNNVDLVLNLKTATERSSYIDILQTVEGIKFLQSANLLDKVCQKFNFLGVKYPNNAYNYCVELLNCYLETCKTCNDPIKLEISSSLITISFSQAKVAEKYASHLLAITGPLSPLRDSEKLENFQKHTEAMVFCITNNFKDFSEVMFEKIASPLVREYVFMMLEFLQKNRIKHRKFVWNLTNHLIDDPKFLERAIGQWQAEDRCLDTIRCFKLLLGADPGILSRSKGKRIFNVLWDNIVDFISAERPFKIKNSALDLLPVIINMGGTYTDIIKERLKRIVNELPTGNKRTLKKGSDKYNEATSILNKLLDTMVTFKSVLIFNLLIPVFVQKDHVSQEAFVKSINSFSKGLGMNSFLGVTQQCFDFFKDQNYIYHRRNLAELIITLLSSGEQNQIVAFYERNLDFLMSNIQNHQISDVSGRIQQLKMKTCCLRLIQTLHEVLPLNLLDKDSALNNSWRDSAENKVYVKGEKLTLSSELIHAYKEMRKDRTLSTLQASDWELREALLGYNQAVLNASLAFSLLASPKEAYFATVLGIQNGKPIYDFIVDSTKQIYLKIQLDQPPVKVRLKELGSVSRRASDLDVKPQNIAYMASIALSGSSLTQPSLSDVILEDNQQTESRDTADEDTVMLDAPDTDDNTVEDEDVEFEIDVLNQNPCMKYLTGALQKLHTKICPPTLTNSNPPRWMTGLLSVFKSSDVPYKTYIAKLISNYPFAFENYADMWILPLMEFITKGGFGEPINYLVQDLCIILSHWGKEVKNIEDSEGTIKKFMEFLIKNAHHELPRICRSNIQIIKSIIENWGKMTIVPTRAIYDAFNHSKGDEHKNIVGLQVAGAFYSNGINIYDIRDQNIYHVTELIFFNDMAQNIFYKGRKSVDITPNAAELMGWSLMFMKSYNSYLHGQLKEKYKQLLIDLGKSPEHSDKMFLKCMNRVYIHDLELGQELFSVVSQKLNQYSTEDKILALNFMNACWKSDDMIYHILRGAGIHRMLSSRDENLQIVCLKILNSIFSVMDDDAVRSTFSKLVKIFPGHHNKECRLLYYSFLRLAYHRNLSDSKHQKIKSQIFTGLIDKDETISSIMFDFIVETFNLNDNIRDTLLKITSELYATDTEDIYLLYATRIILNNTKKTYDFDQPIYDKNLGGAKYDAGYQKINTSWFSTSSMTPLFVTEAESKPVNIEDLEVQLRKTQSLLEFSTTQGTGQTLIATFNPSSQEDSDIERVDDNSLFETSQGTTAEPKAVKKGNPYYTRRFYNESRGIISRFHADRNEQLQKKLRNLINTKKEAGEKKVVMTRSYRAGEIPDIQIKLSEVLIPLEVVSTRDYNISRLLYSSLIVSIVKEIEQFGDEDVYRSYKSELMGYINRNLRNSQLYFTPTIGSFLRIIFDLQADISSRVVKHVSDKSHNHHIGIAILENQISQGNEERPTKRRITDMGPKKEKWIYLSLLYQSIDELEIFENLYLTNVATNEHAIEGIKAQIKGDYAVAFNEFDAVVSISEQTNVNEVESNLWQEQMRYSRIQLNQWDLLARDLATDLKNDFSQLWLSYQDPRLHYFIRSFSKFAKEWVIEDPQKKVPDRIIWSDTNPNPIYKFLDDAYEDDNHREILLNNFACDLSMVEMFRNQYYRSKTFVERAYDSLLNSWTTLHPLAYTSRLNRLAQLQRTVELDDYLQLHRQLENNGKYTENIQKFLDSLVTRYPDTKSDTMDIWYDITLSRFEYIDDLINFASDKVNRVNEAMYRNAKIEFVSAIVNTALVQNNMSTLGKFLKLYKQLNVEYKREIAYIRYFQYVCAQRPAGEKVLYLGKLLHKSLLFKLPENSSQNEQYDWHLTLAEALDVAKIQFINDPNLYNEALNYRKIGLHDLATKLNLKSIVESPDNFIDYLEYTCLTTLKKAERMIANQESKRAEYLWKIGNYCDEALHVLQDKSSTLQPEFDHIEYCEIVIKSYFEAMDRDHKDAADYFTRLLELIETYPETGPLFKEYSLKFETTWKLIRWIPQLVSLIAEPIAKYTFPCLEKIAIHYPKALYYPFQIPRDTYELKKRNMAKEDCESVEKILHLIRSPIMDEFINELKRLSEPKHIVKDFMERVNDEFRDGSVPNSYIQLKFKEFFQLYLNKYSERLGKIYKEEATKHANQFLSVFGEKGEKISRLSDRQFAELDKYWRAYQDEIKLEDTNLKSYSPWLNSFKNIDHDEELEVPGQYTGLSKPHPELHATVISIDSKISVMKSLRKPKRICIYGSNDEKYNFLVKGGEDIRLDERVEQVFSVMNDIVKKNAFCSKNNIQATTYAVIPMATNLGIIEWINDTATLGSFFTNKKLLGTDTLHIGNAFRKYKRNLGLPENTTLAVKYHKAYGVPRDKIASNFKEAYSMMPSNLFRDILFRLASSPEAFLFLRNDFVYSLACICIFGYVLGVGDRHLQNFLLDLNSGRLVPIDFGYAFGVGTDTLPIPELVPFRLTRQLESVLEPLGISGILENSMVQLLNALQSKKELLLNILSIFVKDPLLDWSNLAKKKIKQQKQKQKLAMKKSQKESNSHSNTGNVEEGTNEMTTTTSSTDTTLKWYPQNKIHAVKNKLNLENPSVTITKLLTDGHGNKPYCKDAVKLVEGVPNVDIRADVGDFCKDTNEQVKCLINLATDPSVLGVMFIGWQPYV